MPEAKQKAPESIVTCPGCQTAMQVVLVEPMKPGDPVDQVTYECSRCGTKTQRQIKRDE